MTVNCRMCGRTTLSPARVLFAALLASPVNAAFAGTDHYTFHSLPQPPRAGEPLSIRVVTLPNMCVPLSAKLGVLQSGNVVRYQVLSSDGCFPPNLPAEDRTYAVPSLAAGVYTFRFEVCGFQPTAQSPDGCSLLESRTVAVYGVSGTRATIPALSPLGAILAAFALLATALRERARRFR